ncbi:MAG: hypothetical protein ACE5IR_18650 [bacterium]
MGMILVRNYVKFVLSAVLLWGVACGKQPPEISWTYSDADVIGKSGHNNTSAINIDIYLDATLSMVGFAKTRSSIYNRFLDELEIAAAGSWKTANVQFFKFGTKIKPIDRQGFKAAKAPAFYRERGIFERTNIDSVINRTNNERVSVILTDLFQDDGDVNSIVLQIKEKCFVRGVQTAVLAVPSDFNGTVFDARVAPYRYKSVPGDKSTYRPFYALMFGEERNLQRMLEFLKTAEYVDEEYILIISRRLIKKFKARVTKARKSRSLNMRKMRTPDRYPHHFGFSLRKGKATGTILAGIRFERAPHTADFQKRALELMVFRKSSLPGAKITAQDSVLASDLKLTGLERDGDSLTATIDLDLAEPPGIYSYLVYLQLPQNGGFELPRWIDVFSSQNPTASRDPNKTLNLRKFVIDLMRASQSFSQPQIAKFYMTVYKR